MHTGDSPNAELLKEFMYHAPVGLVQIELNGAIGLINPVAIQVLMPLAKSGDHLTNLFTTLETVAPEIQTMVEDYKAKTGSIVSNHQILIASEMRGQAQSVFYAISLVKIDHNSVMVTLQDVSDAVKRERLLSKQEAWINLIRPTATHYALITLDENGLITQCSNNLQRLTGNTADQITGQSYALFYATDAMTTDRLTDRLREVDSAGVSFDEGWIDRTDGSRFWGHTVITPIASSLQTRSYSLLLRDITESRETMESLFKAASSDQLTGLSNRRAFYEVAELELARYLRKPRPISLLILDIDHFKQVNDSYGHLVGDQVIRNLANILLRSVRSIDVVARIGGEEFAVLLPSTDLSMAATIGERIRRNVEKECLTIANLDRPLAYTVSIGAAPVNGATTSTDELLAAADESLYAAKRAGRNKVFINKMESFTKD
jgi:diguanylate cyclase (GGDEF)-like protein/PAS domain S-box-containing protein